MIKTETYTLRISTHNPILSEPEFIEWLKQKGHAVSLTNNKSSSVNGMLDGRMGISNYSWAAEVFFKLLDNFEDEIEAHAERIRQGAE